MTLAGMPLSRDDSHLVVFWLVASLAGVLLAMNLLSASFVDGAYVPAGNDAFYHARRIIDAAIGERGFYQFDDTIHVPEGSWLTWPWAYDYLLSRVLLAGLLVAPSAAPMTILAYVPVGFLLVNTGLYVLLLRESGLGKSFSILALAAFVLSPLTYALHGVGAIDHHFIELGFVLATTWLGLRFFADNASRSNAIALGAVLGIAPAFHNSLFVLQVPVLVAAGVCWLHGTAIDKRGALLLGISLVATCLLALLPSGTFRAMHFEFATHSWFHLYIAACSAVALWLLGRLPRTPGSGVLLAAAGLALSIPLVVEIARGASFMAGATVMLDDIVEVWSPLDFLLRSGLRGVTRYYGWLVLLAPFVAAAAAAMLVRRRPARDVFLLSAATFGLVLLLTQYRLHPFGTWALPVATLWLLQQFAEQRHWQPRAVAAGATVGLLLAFQPPLAHQLFVRQPVGMNEIYQYTRPVYLALGDLCAENPGVVLAQPDDGHPIRYHSNCPVIANNFLLTKLHGDKALTVQRLLDASPEELRNDPVGVAYVLIRPQDLWHIADTGLVPTPTEDVKAANPALVRALMGPSLPAGFELLGEIPINDERGLAYARLVRVIR